MEESPKSQENTPRKRRDPWSLLASQLGLLSSPIAPDVAEAATRIKPEKKSSEEQPTVDETEKTSFVEEVVEIQAERMISANAFDDQNDELPSVLWEPKKVTIEPSSIASSKIREIKSPFASRQPASPKETPLQNDRTQAEANPEEEEPIPESAFSSGVGRQKRDKRSRGREETKEHVRESAPRDLKEPKRTQQPKRESRKPVDPDIEEASVSGFVDSYEDVLDNVSFEPKTKSRSPRRRGRREEPIPEPVEEELFTPVFEDDLPEEPPKRSRRHRQESEETPPSRPVRGERGERKREKETTASIPDFSQLHKKIPSWDDAIGMIIDTNLERSPNRGNSRKGSSRGRRR